MVIKEVPDASHAYTLVEEVKSHGLRANRDFKWWYKSAEIDDWFAPKGPSIVKFEFVDKQWETFFSLKWI